MWRHWHVRAGKMACSQEVQESRPAIAAPAKAKTGWGTCMCFLLVQVGSMTFLALILKPCQTQANPNQQSLKKPYHIFWCSPTRKHSPSHPLPSPLTANKRPTIKHRPPTTSYQPPTPTNNQQPQIKTPICKHKTEFPRRCSTPLPKWEFPQHSHHFGLEGKLYKMHRLLKSFQWDALQRYCQARVSSSCLRLPANRLGLHISDIFRYILYILYHSIQFISNLL